MGQGCAYTGPSRGMVEVHAKHGRALGFASRKVLRVL